MDILELKLRCLEVAANSPELNEKKVTQVAGEYMHWVLGNAIIDEESGEIIPSFNKSRSAERRAYFKAKADADKFNSI